MANVGQWKGVFDSTNIGECYCLWVVLLYSMWNLLIAVATSIFDVDESSRSSSISSPKVRGLLAFMLWRAAYWTKQVSLQNKMLILMYWFKSAVFGRDVSRF